MAKKPEIRDLQPPNQRHLLEALRARTVAATKAVLAASSALQELKRATRAAQAMGEPKVPTEHPEKKTTTPETNTQEDRPSSPPRSNGSTR